MYTEVLSYYCLIVYLSLQFCQFFVLWSLVFLFMHLYDQHFYHYKMSLVTTTKKVTVLSWNWYCGKPGWWWDSIWDWLQASIFSWLYHYFLYNYLAAGLSRLASSKVSRSDIFPSQVPKYSELLTAASGKRAGITKTCTHYLLITSFAWVLASAYMPKDVPLFLLSSV